MDCVPPTGPTDQQIREIMEIADKAARAAGARGHDLDDVRQMTVQKLIAKWHTPSVTAARAIGGRQWRGFVGVTARHTFYDLLRAEKRRRRRQRLAFDVPDRRPARPGVHRAEDHDRSEIDLFLAQEVVKDLIDEHLDGTEKTVAWALFVDGKSVKRLAEELGKASRTIRAYRQASIAKLRATLRPRRQEKPADDDKPPDDEEDD